MEREREGGRAGWREGEVYYTRFIVKLHKKSRRKMKKYLAASSEKFLICVFCFHTIFFVQKKCFGGSWSSNKRPLKGSGMFVSVL